MDLKELEKEKATVQERLDFNMKKAEMLSREIEEKTNQAKNEIQALKNESSKLTQPILEDRGQMNLLNKLINKFNEVESKK